MPTGWTDDYEEMGGSCEWDEDDGLGTLAAVSLGLGKPTPQMGRKVAYGGGQSIFTVEKNPGKLYLWNAESSDVLVITSPTTLDEIKQLISANKMKDMKLEKVENPTTAQQEEHRERHWSERRKV